VNSVVSETSHMLRRIIGEDIRLVTNLCDKLENSRLDPNQVGQVILNLAVNARDAMPGGGVLHLETSNVDLDNAYTQEHPPVQPGRYVMLAVSDTGTGIDKSILPRIFDPFFTTKEVGKGTGLGLSIVYGIVKQSGGYIWVYSEPGHGTTFKLYFPAISAALESPVARSEGPSESGGQTVLIVEDEAIIRSNVRECLQQLGYQVLEAENGEAALQICDGLLAKIDLVLTDLVMPGMGGHELAGELAQRHPAVRMLFMSGYTEDSAARRDILLQGSAFLQKPFSVADLSSAVHQALARRLVASSPSVENRDSRRASFRTEQSGPRIIQVVPAIAFQPLSFGIRQVQDAVSLGAHHFRPRPVEQNVTRSADPDWNAEAPQANSTTLLLIVDRPGQRSYRENQKKP
jgi:CheY-like chemotaxis protein